MSDIKRVTLPNEVADAIETFRAGSLNNAQIIELAVRGGMGPSALTLRRYVTEEGGTNFDTLISALINDYDRDLTAEQRVHAEIRRMYTDKCYTAEHGLLTAQREFDRGFVAGARFVIDTLGIKIEGVNA
ncbi:hypothetical protein LOZ80_15265 [Paenibacillus sp. HWE-109]|uniref:hypothetical protein n=1 Tax=Paenibacillus sp. HWE-109 TaxID=1306526 RepID=UPI001EDCAF36|nr:hypothetical protein [Paenibacillus sp. HWE-109]UKS30219.1 hypothetical protein LOZ80_15265 [Paenibacillus sp. HWE-109]